MNGAIINKKNESMRNWSSKKVEKMLQVLTRFLDDESGATAIEYAFIASLIAVAAIVAMGAVGNALENTFNDVAGEL